MACTSSVLDMFGRMWRKMIVASPAPLAIAARHELRLAERERLAARDPDAAPGRRRSPSAIVAVVEPRAEDRRQPDREDHEREREHHVGAARDDRVEPAAVVAGEQAERHRDQQREPRREEADLHDARAPQTRRENTSRPSSSVPSRWCHDGCASTSLKSASAWPYGATQRREDAAIVMKTTMTTRPRPRPAGAGTASAAAGAGARGGCVDGDGLARTSRPQLVIPRPRDPDPRVEQRVDDVDEQVHDHVRRRP